MRKHRSRAFCGIALPMNFRDMFKEPERAVSAPTSLATRVIEPEIVGNFHSIMPGFENKARSLTHMATEDAPENFRYKSENKSLSYEDRRTFFFQKDQGSGWKAAMTWEIHGTGDVPLVLAKGLDMYELFESLFNFMIGFGNAGIQQTSRLVEEDGDVIDSSNHLPESPFRRLFGPK